MSESNGFQTKTSTVLPKWQADIAKFGVTSIDTTMLRRDKRGLFPGCCESVYGMIDKLCHELDVTRAELAEWRKAAMDNGADVNDLTKLLYKYGI